MEMKTLWKAYVRRHKGSLAGVFALLFIVSVSLVTVLTVWDSSVRYVREEMERLGFGDLTAWVSQVPDITQLTDEIDSLDAVEITGVQKLIYSEYEANGQESDSEGQLVVYEPENYAYRIFLDDLSGYQAGEAVIHSGELYAPISLQSMFGAEIGDEISFPIARNGVEQTFIIKGWFEDPFMGSSMIGMKSFLICNGDYEEIVRKLSASGIDGLARDGFMIHIFKNRDSEVSIAGWNAMLNQETQLSQFAEFTHSRSAIEGFMLTLQNVFTGLLSAFVLVLLLVAMVVLGHGIMPGVSVNGVDYTANVITEPERFHILSGRTCLEADEIVLTEFVAADLDVGIGDTVTVGGGTGSMPYRVSGIYQCANDMGANVGLSRDGYAKIGRETAGMWCVHYFLEDVSIQQEVMLALEGLYGGDVYLHENSWPGLFGILSAMRWLMHFMYAVVSVFVFVVTALSAGRLLTMEKKDLGIYRAIGFPPDRLRLSFSLRFGIVSGTGSVLGSLLAVLFTDPLVAALLRQFGISNFSGKPSALNIMIPIVTVTGLFMLFAWLDAEKIRKMRLTVLVAKSMSLS